MMKNIVLIFFLFIGYNVVAQRLPSGTPTQFSTGWFKQGYQQSDSGTIVANRDTAFRAKYSGTIVFRPTDKKFYYFDSTVLAWFPLAPSAIDTTPLHNQIVLKLNISDTTNKWWGIGRRWADTLYRINDSTIGYTINGDAHSFEIKGGASGGGGTGTVTSVGLSMPSAFSVTPSSITTNGTFAVSGAGTSAQYIRGNGTLATTDTGMIPDFHLKVRSLFSATSPITFNQTTGILGVLRANNSGQLGVATFNNADFTDNGAGLISLRNPSGGAGVDTIYRTEGIDSVYFTINGTTYAIKDSVGSGSGTNNANIGPGFRWLNGVTQEIRTVANSITIIWDSTSTANTLTAKADTTVLATKYDLTQITPSLTATQIAFGSVGNTITSEAAFTYSATNNKLTVDSVDAIQTRQDSSLFVRQSPFLAADTLLADGNSITYGLNASPITVAFAYLIASSLGLTINNIAVSGTGMCSIANRFLIEKEPGNTVMTTIMGGLNDVRRNGVARKTLNKIINGYKSIFANQYLKSYTNAGTGGVNVTRYGTWTANWNAQAEGGKATVGAYTSTTNDSIVYVFTDSTVIVGLMGGDGSASSYIGTDVDVYIDGVLNSTINTNDQTDGVADGSGLDNKRCAVAFYFGSLTYASHTIKLVKKSTGGGGFLICDYFGHFIPRPTAYAMLWFHAPYLTAVGYATAPANANNAAIDSINNKIDSLIATPFIKWYPTYRVQTNNCYDTTSGTDVDGIHPNNIGHSQIYTCGINTINAINGGGGITGKMYYSTEFRGVVEGEDDAFLMLRRADLRYIQNQDNLTQDATFKISGEGTLSRATTDGTISGASLTVPDRQRAGFISGLNGPLPFFGIRNNTNSPDSKSYDWFLGTAGIQYRILSDDLMTSADYLRMVRSGMTIDTIQMPKLDVTGTLKVYTHAIAANSDSALVWNRATNAYEYAKINTGSSGITSLNALTAGTQTFATGTSGTDFNISSSTSTHTFNIPSASTTNRGLVTTSSQTFGGEKTFNNGAIVTNPTSSSGVSFIVSGDRSLAAAPGVSGVGVYIAPFTYTNTSAAGTESSGQNMHLIGVPTLTSSNAISYTGSVATVRFVGSPIASGSTTIAHPYNILANDVNYLAGIAMSLNEQSGDATLANSSGINIYTGAGGNTWTLPALSMHPGKFIFVKNAGSGSLSVQRAGSDTIYDTSSVTSISIAAGAARIFMAGSAAWYVQ